MNVYILVKTLNCDQWTTTMWCERNNKRIKDSPSFHLRAQELQEENILSMDLIY